MPGAEDLIHPFSGKPIIKEPNLIVIKCQKGSNPHPDILRGLVSMGYAVMVLPMDYEFMMGSIAKAQLDSIHQGIHALANIAYNEFTTDELVILYKAVDFLCQKTQPKPSSPEVQLAKKLKHLTEPKAPAH